MKIIFIRHGIAEAYRENDKDRRLTLEGKIKLRENFKNLKERDFSNYKFLSSDYKRAVETAEILSQIINKKFFIKNFLGGVSTRELLEKLKMEKSENFILISHEPYISTWIHELTGKSLIVSRGTIHEIET